MQEEAVLFCSQQAGSAPDLLTGGLTFSWAVGGNTTLAGLELEGGAGSELRLGVRNASLGEYSCTVANAVGESEPCRLEITQILLASGLTQQQLLLIIVLAAVAAAVILAAALFACWRRFCRNNKPRDEGMKCSISIHSYSALFRSTARSRTD